MGGRTNGAGPALSALSNERRVGLNFELDRRMTSDLVNVTVVTITLH